MATSVQNSQPYFRVEVWQARLTVDGNNVGVEKVPLKCSEG